MDTESLKFENLKTELMQPVKLSETERQKFKEIFEKIRKIIDQKEIKVLEMDKDDAYRYMQIFLTKFSRVESEFTGEITREPEKEEIRTETLEKKKPLKKPVIKHEPGAFRKMYDKLTQRQRDVANRSLDCIKNALAFEESGEAPPEEVLCNDCSYKAMIACITTEDPSIKDEMDLELEKAP